MSKSLLKSLCFISGSMLIGMLFACTGNSLSPVEQAEEEFASGRYGAAQSMCDSLILGSEFSSLTVDELCRLSILTSQLADLSDDDANMALATRCMQAALQREPDSVLAFVHSLPADMQSSTLFIRQLTRTIDPTCEPGYSLQLCDTVCQPDTAGLY